MELRNHDIKVNARSGTYHIIHDCESCEELLSIVTEIISAVPDFETIDTDAMTGYFDPEAVNSILSAQAENLQDCVSVSLPMCTVTIYATGEIILADLS